MNDRELTERMERLINTLLPGILRQTNNSIRMGIIRNLNTLSRVCDVEILGTTEIISNVKYIASSPSSLVDGLTCLLISNDPKLRNLSIAIIAN